MLAAYGLDVLRPGLSNRRMQVLLDRLPTHTRTSADPSDAWSTESHLLANVFDAVQVMTYVLVKVNAPKAHPVKPKPMTRPSGPPRPPAATDPRPAAPLTGERRASWTDALRKLAATDGVQVRRG